MVLYYSEGSPTTEISDDGLKAALYTALDKLNGKAKRNVMLVPPDFTRFHSKSGIVTQHAYAYFGEYVKDIMPALGTHAPMTPEEITKACANCGALHHSHEHDRCLVTCHTSFFAFTTGGRLNDVVTIGEVPRELVQEASDGQVNEPWPAQLNKLIWEGNHDLIVSIGQVVPHEVMGMANYNKNLFVGTGGSDAINFSHFIGAVYGMERMMGTSLGAFLHASLGRANNPLRRILNYASEHFLQHLPLLYVQTVIGRRTDGSVVTRGVFIGDDDECFTQAAALSLQVNFSLLPAPLDEVVVYLDPAEFKTTWLGNKSIYRTRMAIADQGTLVVLAPGVTHFGEDKQIDALIRKYGYRTTPEVLAHIHANRDLMRNLSAAAHLIHGSSENRFRIVYACAPGGLSQTEVEGVGFEYAPLQAMLDKYEIADPATTRDGWHTAGGRSFYYVSNPAMGLWAYEGRFEASSRAASAPPVARSSLVAGQAAREPCVDAGVGGGPFTKHDHI
ncbi:hypothetical protein ACHHYP_08633 [Achlya hypogyna]|uniref:LarA-like N-terminal domain-containing protein n=1 Tax=Achlya hypogyna TaxID=1202772 RepID=A0A1V9ZKJ4_ACHHY|nr:hypothetical protein ACHHYP_08633 [Achlya hypogyna]